MDFSPHPVLVVDERFESKRLREVLFTAGFRQFFQATNRERAIEIVLSQALGLALISLQLPESDGLALIQEIRRGLPDPQRRVPLLAVSNVTDGKTVMAARNAGANHFLAKPYSSGHVMRSAELVIKDPRGFLIVRNYAGPDRRRRIDGSFLRTDRRALDGPETAEAPA
jgi:DNA-binding response OmpR family regulator